jgi:hypothetical protein
LLATFLLPALADIPDRLSRWVPWLGTALVLCVIASELPQLLRLSRQMDDVIEVGAELPRGAKLIPMDFMDRGWGTIDKPQPLAHAWARLVETRDVVAADLFAAGKPRMGGDHFRMLSFRPQVLDVATGTLPWPSSEGVHALARQCQDRTSESCRIALSRRRESLAAVIDRYQYVLLLSPPDYVREALAEHLTFRKEVGVAWLYEAAGRPAGGRAPGGAVEGGPARSP